MRKHGGIILLILLFLGGIIIFGYRTLRESAPQNNTTETNETIPVISKPTVTIIDPVRGPKEAPITIIEFGDYLCEFCKRMEPIVDEILASYPTKVRLVWKDFPNDEFHPGATLAAEAARCAGREGRYWEFHDLLMERAGFGIIPYADLAVTAGLDTTAFDECLTSHITQPIVAYTSREALGLGLTGVPYFFINGLPFDGTTLSEFQTAIEKLEVSR